MTKKTKRNLLIGIGVLAVAALVAITVANNRNKKQGVGVEFGEAERRTIEERVTASGRIFPVTEVSISSDVSGEVVELPIAEGDSVRAGQLLARIDPDAIQSRVAQGRAAVDGAQATAAQSRAAIEQARAQVAQLEAQLINQRAVLERTRQLVGEGLASQADLDAAEAAVRTTEANVDAGEASVRAAQEQARASDFNVKSARASLSELSTNLRRTRITAPMTGVVSALLVEEGERVVGTIQMSGTEIARIADLSRMEVQVEVSENDIPRVTLGDPVDIEVDAYLDRTFKGRVAEISNSANNLATGAAALQSLTSDQVTNFVVTIEINPASYADLVTERRPFPFRPGMSAAVEILTEVVEDAVAVPIAAVTAREVDEEKQPGVDAAAELEEIVWVVPAGADTVGRRAVKTGVQDRDYIQVVSGVDPGERIVVGPYAQVSRKLESGDQVYEDEDDDDEEDADED